MYAEDDYFKFTRNLSKFVNTQWSKVRRSSSNSLKSDKNIDDQLEEEYETLLREINYLISEKSCHLSFINDNFNKAKSSEDLTKILEKHSSEVLKNYIKQHDKKVKNGSFNNRNDLINYVTEIVVSRNTCNNKLCSCKPLKASKEVLTDNNLPKKNGKVTQTSKSGNEPAEKATDAKPTIFQKANQTKFNIEVKKVNATVQTDDWSHDPFCTCGCCPKSETKIDTKSVITDEKTLRDAATSDKKITVSKNVFANCVGKNEKTNTSTQRLCVPRNFETLIENNKNMQNFSICTEKKDCACDAYDIKEALKRGLVLPSSDICIQKRNVIVEEDAKGKSKKKGKTADSISSDDNEISDPSSLENGKKKYKKKEKENKKKNEKENNKKRDSGSSSSSPRDKPKKKQKGETTSCFGQKKKSSGCDEYCLGISRENRSIQTLLLGTQDKSEDACICNENGRKVAETATELEAATQVSIRSSDDEVRKFKQTRKTTARTDIKQDRDTSFTIDSKQEATQSNNYGEDKGSGANRDIRVVEKGIGDQEKDGNNQDNKEKLNGSTCNKCGRLKRECNSGCRNTIIIPYGSGSNKSLPAGEAESLRMLIKMQNKETNRQFDNLTTELGYQKNEIRRLNDMYQKMMENYYDMQKSISTSKSQSKKSSDASRDYRYGNIPQNKRSESAKECGCSFSSECKVVKKRDMPTGRSNNNSYNTGSNNSNSTNHSQLRRFGPPNTAVAINRCDVCNVEITGNSIKAYAPPREIDHHDGDKQRKNQLNQSQKGGDSNQNIALKRENVQSGGKGDNTLPKTDSVSTIYKKDTKASKSRMDGLVDKRDGHENLLDNIKIDEMPDSFRTKSNTDMDKETDESEQGKKTRGIYSSRVLIWLKKSWISIKHKREECKRRDKERREGYPGLKCMLNFCEGKAKQAATGMWKDVRPPDVDSPPDENYRLRNRSWKYTRGK